MADLISFEEAIGESPQPAGDPSMISFEEAAAAQAPTDWEKAKTSFKSISGEEFQDTNLFMQLGASIYKHLTGQTTEGSLSKLTPEAKAYAVKMGVEEPELPWYRMPSLLVEKFAESPMHTLVELGKGIMYDPELLGVGALRSPSLVARLAQGGAIAGGLTAAQSLAQQSVQKDEVSYEEAGKAALASAPLGAILAGVAGGPKRVVKIPERAVDTLSPEYMNTVRPIEKSPPSLPPNAAKQMEATPIAAPDSRELPPPATQQARITPDNTEIIQQPAEAIKVISEESGLPSERASMRQVEGVIESGNLPSTNVRPAVKLPEPEPLTPDTPPWQRATDFLDRNLGAISTRVSNIDPELGLALRRHEMTSLGELHRRIKEVDPFLQELDKLPKYLKENLSRNLISNDKFGRDILFEQAGNPELVKAFGRVQNVLKDVGAELQGTGRLKELRPDYFPRIVVNRKGLLNSLGMNLRNGLEKELHAAERGAVKSRGYGLTETESSAIINKYLKRTRGASGSSKPGFAKERVFEDVTRTTAPFYASPATSLHAYLKKATDDLETSRFFGQDKVMRTTGDMSFIDLDASIGNLVDRKIRAGTLSYEKAPELASMLQSRFGAGERRPLGAVQDIKNIAYAGLLGNPISAIGQLADVGTSAYVYNMKPTLRAVVGQITRGNKVKLEDFGLVNHISEEFIDARSSARFLQKVFKVSGFELADRFGKEVSLNAALNKYSSLAKTVKGQKTIADKYGASFKEELPALIKDLQSGVGTERVKLLLFSELSDIQPISKAEMPQGYLDHPNGRVIYMLKSFMLKQLDIVRRDAYNEIKKGNIAKGAKNLASYGLLLGGAGATVAQVQNFLLGKPVDFKTTDIPEHFFKNFGWSSYVINKAAGGKPVEATIGTFAPPYRMMDDVIRLDPKATNYIPVVGKFIYSWELGGKEKAEKKLLQDQMAERRKLMNELTGRK